MRRGATFKSVVALSGLIAGGLTFLSRPVAALTGPYAATVPAQQVPWQTVPAGMVSPGLAFPQFDPADGTLARVDIRFDADLTGAVKAENEGAVAQSVGVELAAVIDIDTLDPAQPVALRLADARTVDLDAFDGTIDFAGPSGTTLTNLADQATQTVTITDPTVLAAFIGPGTVTLPAEATEDHQTDGDGTENVSYQATAGVDATVTYFVGRIDVAKGPAPDAVEGGDDAQTVVAGGAVSFTIKVVNTGDVAVREVVVSDAAAADCQRDLGDLAAGEETTFTCTQTDVTADFENSATASGLADEVLVTDTDTSAVVVGDARVTISKVADLLTVPRGGDATFTITVANEGDVTLDPVVVTDVDSTGTPHPDCGRTFAMLLPGEAEAWNCTLSALQATVTNTASVDATVLGGDALATRTASATVQVAGLSLVKRVNGDDANTAPGVAVPVGGALEFTYDVANDGDVPISELTLTDDKLAENDISQLACPHTSLDPGESMTCTATGTQQSTDVVMNTATVTGTTPTGETVQASDVAHHHGVAPDPEPVECASTPAADAVEGVRFFVNGDEDAAVDDLARLRLHPGDVVTMTFTGLAADAEGCTVSLAVYATDGPVFDIADDQELDSSATCVPGDLNGGDCVRPDGTYQLEVTISTPQGRPFQIDAVTGEPLPIVGPNGGWYSGVLNRGTNRLISAQTGSGK